MIINTCRQGKSTLYITGLALMLSLGLVRFSAAGSASSEMNFSAVFAGGSCDISTSISEIVFGGGELIEPNDIISNPPQEAFDLILSNCSGAGLTPKITVTGESTALFGLPLFRSTAPATASDGYGILLSTLGNGSFNSNMNLAQDNTISTKNWSTDTPLSELDTTLPVSAVLTCGTCDYSGRRSGDLIATVTFDFVYD